MQGFPGGSEMVKSLITMPETWGQPLGLGRSPGEGKHSCLENSMDRGAWWATVHGAAKS